MLREWEALVIRTVQIHGRVYVRQLPGLLAETGVFLGVINPSRDLNRLKTCGYLSSRYVKKNPDLGVRQVLVYRVTKRGEKALEEYVKHIDDLTLYLSD